MENVKSSQDDPNWTGNTVLEFCGQSFLLLAMPMEIFLII